MRKVTWLVAAGLLVSATGCIEVNGMPNTAMGGYPSGYGYPSSSYGSNGYYGQPAYSSGGGLLNSLFSQPSYYQPQPTYYQPAPQYVPVPVASQPQYVPVQSNSNRPRWGSRDRNNDGVADWRQRDRNNDGVPDYQQRDRNGDGIPDYQQRRSRSG